MKKIPQGTAARTEWTVEPTDLAAVHGSGSLPVYATPAMVAFMEKTACALLQPYLEEGETTVGTAISAKHLKASLPGQKLQCMARLTLCDGRRYVFEIEVKDALGVVGTAEHERFLIKSESFMKKAQEHSDACALTKK